MEIVDEQDEWLVSSDVLQERRDGVEQAKACSLGIGFCGLGKIRKELAELGEAAARHPLRLDRVRTKESQGEPSRYERNA